MKDQNIYKESICQTLSDLYLKKYQIKQNIQKLEEDIKFRKRVMQGHTISKLHNAILYSKRIQLKLEIETLKMIKKNIKELDKIISVYG